MHNAVEQRRQAFSVWLRTGRLPRSVDSREFKFNPWHDPRNGRFTFAGAGIYVAPDSAGLANGKDQEQSPLNFKDDPAEPRLNSDEEVDDWAARQLAKYGDKPGHSEAIEARRQLYRKELASRPRGALTKVAEFVNGYNEGFYNVGKGVVTGIYSLATTNPITSVQNIEFGLARTIDGAIAAEDTPAHVQLRRAAHSIINASAHDVGYALGTVGGNVALAVVPGAVSAKISAVRRLGAVDPPVVPRNPSKIIWVDENAGFKGVAKDYNDSAMGARSNVATKRPQVPAIERKLPNGKTRTVRFDGIDGEYLIDRKWSIYMTKKAKEQALRQSEALKQNGLSAIWQVPTELQKRRAYKLLNQLGISNIHVKVVTP